MLPAREIYTILVFIVLGVFLNYLSKFLVERISRTKAWRFTSKTTLFFFGDGEIVLDILLKKLSKIEKTPYYLRSGILKFLYLNNADDIQIVLNNSNSLSKSYYYRFFEPLIGDGLLSGPVHIWKRHRRIITPVFDTKLFRNFFSCFNKINNGIVEEMKPAAENGETVNLWTYTAPLSFDLIGETMMGFDSGAIIKDHEKREFHDKVEMLADISGLRIYKIWLHPDLIFKIYSKYFKNVYSLLYEVQDIVYRVIGYKKKKFLENKEKGLIDDSDEIAINEGRGGSFLDTLIRMNGKSEEFTDKELYDECVTMMIAGSETNALTNSFTLLMLAIHQDIQAKVYEEIIEAVGVEPQFIDFEDINKMPLLERCIKETLRMFPVGAFILREATGDFKLSDGHIVKTGTTIVVAPMMIHHMEKYYNNPNVWNPDNFLPENEEKRHKYAYLPFSGGPRGCIGSKYAMLSMKSTLATILKKYRLTTNIKIEDIKLKIDILMRSVNGYPVKLHLRQH